jgi:hypothetical protein
MARIPTQFVHAGNTYQIQPMDALVQLSLAQRLSPIIIPFLKLATGGVDATALGNVAEAAEEDAEGLLKAPKLDVGAAFAPVFDNMAEVAAVLQKMPLDVTQSIYRDCLRHLQRQSNDGGGWQIVWNDRANVMMFEELQGFDVLILSSEVVKDQLANFITGMLSKFSFRPRSQPTTR